METNSKKTFTDSQKQALIQEWRESGKTKLDFCKERDLKYFTFVNWSSDKKKTNKPVSASPFIPVKVSQNSDALFAQLKLRNGAVVNIYGPVEAAYLSALVK